MKPTKPAGVLDRLDLDEDELVTILQEQEHDSIGHADELSDTEDDNLERYLGMPYGDEEEGRSAAISTDCAEVVDWALPDLLEPFLSGDRIVTFEPTSRAAEAFAEDATDYIDHVFRVDNDGDIFLYDAVKTALIQRSCVAKTVWEDDDDVGQETLTGLSAMDVAELQSDPSVTILSQEGEPLDVASVDPQLAQAFIDGMAYTVEIERRKRHGLPRVTFIPPEHYRRSRRATSVDTADYQAHVEIKTRADLIDMGFDEEIVMSARESENDDEADNDRSDLRFFDEDEETGKNYGKELNREVTLYEEYIRINGELIQVFRVGRTLLQEPTFVDEVPFDVWTADRIPGRISGLSLVDKTKQTQRIKTSLLRSHLDQNHLATRPRWEVPEPAVGEDTYDDLLNPQIGGLVRVRQPGMIRPVELPDRSASSLNSIMYFDSVREQQSGITRNGMALSSEVIDPKSAQESRRVERNEQIRKRLMVRMLARTFLVPIFQKMLRCVVRHQDFVREIRVGNQFRDVDPRSWTADLRADVAVGLGHTNRDEDLMAAQTILAFQAQGREMGLVTEQHLYEAAKKLVSAVGWNFPEKYVLDPASPEAQQIAQARAQQPDPAAAEMQAKLQIEMQKLQMEQKRDELKAQREIEIEMLRARAKQAIESQRLDFDHRAELARIEQEYALGMDRLVAEMELKREQMAIEATMQREQMRIESQQRAQITDVRMGGRLG